VCTFSCISTPSRIPHIFSGLRDDVFLQSNLLYSVSICDFLMNLFLSPPCGCGPFFYLYPALLFLILGGNDLLGSPVLTCAYFISLVSCDVPFSNLRCRVVCQPLPPSNGLDEDRNSLIMRVPAVRTWISESRRCHELSYCGHRESVQAKLSFGSHSFFPPPPSS